MWKLPRKGPAAMRTGILIEARSRGQAKTQDAASSLLHTCVLSQNVCYVDRSLKTQTLRHTNKRYSLTLPLYDFGGNTPAMSRLRVIKPRCLDAFQAGNPRFASDRYRLAHAVSELITN